MDIYFWIFLSSIVHYVVYIKMILLIVQDIITPILLSKFTMCLFGDLLSFLVNIFILNYSTLFKEL